jgi:hypothetical protein
MRDGQAAKIRIEISEGRKDPMRSQETDADHRENGAVTQIQQRDSSGRGAVVPGARVWTAGLMLMFIGLVVFGFAFFTRPIAHGRGAADGA